MFNSRLLFNNSRSLMNLIINFYRYIAARLQQSTTYGFQELQCSLCCR